MAKRKHKPRLVAGDYLWVHDHSPFERLFFEAIQRNVPMVLRRLNRDVLPVFKRLQAAGMARPSNPELQRYIWDWAHDHHLVNEDGRSEKGSRRRAVKKFVGLAEILDPTTIPPNMRFFLSWVLFAAFGTLRTWATTTPGGKTLKWTLPVQDFELGILTEGLADLDNALDELFRSPTASGLKYEFQSAIWNPQQETRSQCIHRVLVDVETQLNGKLDKDEALLQATGFQKSPRIVDVEHYEWLVHFQIQGRSYSSIAKQSPSQPAMQTVSDGVKQAARLVIGPDWDHWLRPGLPGRPLKS